MSQTEKNIKFLDDLLNNHPVLKKEQEVTAYDYISRNKSFLKPAVKMINLCSNVQQIFYNELINGFSKINNRKINYMEIGLYYGASLVSAISHNFDKLNKVVVNDLLEIDNSIEWRHNTLERFMKEFFKGLNKSTGKEYYFNSKENIYKLNQDLDLTLVVGDCWKVKNNIFDEWGSEKVDIYYYDGDHSKESQKEAIIQYYPCYAEEFIYLVDDYENDEVQEGTKEGIDWLKTQGYKVLYEQDTMNRRNGEQYSKNGWGDGQNVFYLKKI